MHPVFSSSQNLIGCIVSLVNYSHVELQRISGLSRYLGKSIESWRFVYQKPFDERIANCFDVAKNTVLNGLKNSAFGSFLRMSRPISLLGFQDIHFCTTKNQLMKKSLYGGLFCWCVDHYRFVICLAMLVPECSRANPTQLK